jgi:putative spermidine/putrescine transport system permease protein
VSIFSIDALTETLPIQMQQYVEDRTNSTIGAISTALAVLTIIALVIGDRLVGLRRLADV